MSARLRDLNPKTISPDLEDRLKKLPERADRLRSQSVPNIGSGHAIQVVAQFRDLLDWVERVLPPPEPPKVSVDWKEVSTKSQLPPELLRRLRSVEASLKAIEPRAAEVTEKVAAIESAHEAAESLPTDMQTLQEARDEISKIQEEIAKAAEEAEKDAKETAASLEAIRKQDAEAKQLIQNLGAAYRVTTTKGLAASFANKAVWLNASVVAWVIGLLGALYIGAETASKRFETLEGLLNQDINSDRLPPVAVPLGLLWR